MPELAEIPWQVGVLFAVLFGVLLVKIVVALLRRDGSRLMYDVARKIGTLGTSLFSANR